MILQLIGGENNLNTVNEAGNILVAAPVLLHEVEVVGSTPLLMHAVENAESHVVSRPDKYDGESEIPLQQKRSWSTARSSGDKPSHRDRAKRLREDCPRLVSLLRRACGTTRGVSIRWANDDITDQGIYDPVRTPSDRYTVLIQLVCEA